MINSSGGCIYKLFTNQFWLKILIDQKERGWKNLKVELVRKKVIKSFNNTTLFFIFKEGGDKGLDLTIDPFKANSDYANFYVGKQIKQAKFIASNVLLFFFSFDNFNNVFS